MEFNWLVAVIGVIPGLVWLIFFVEEDDNREPIKDIFLTLLIAFVVTVLLAIALDYSSTYLRSSGITNLILESDFSNVSLYGNAEFITLFVLAFLEEFIKFLAVFIGVRRLADFDQPVDVMVYMTVAAMGFAMIENIGANFKVIELSKSIGLVVQVSVIRFIGAALLHGLASGVLGYYWAKGIMKGRTLPYVVFGLLFATALHTIFNYLILIDRFVFRQEDTVAFGLSDTPKICIHH